jgi:hypothetical protein
MSNEQQQSNDDDFQFISADLVVSSRGGRKNTTIKAPSFWSRGFYDYQGEYNHYRALQQNYRRRHKVEETPYDHLVNPILAKQEEYASLFPVTLIELQLIVKEEEEAEIAKEQAKSIAEKKRLDDLNVDVTCENCGDVSKFFSAIAYSSFKLDEDKYICQDCDDLSMSVCIECGEVFDRDDEDNDDEICGECC